MTAPARSLVLCAALSCAKPPAPTLTPEEALASAADGARINVRGNVFTVTFDSNPTGYALSGDRWALVRTVVPRHVQMSDLDTRATLAAWSLGLYLPAAALASRALTLPQVGDVVEATGTFSRAGAWNG